MAMDSDGLWQLHFELRETVENRKLQFKLIFCKENVVILWVLGWVFSVWKSRDDFRHEYL